MEAVELLEIVDRGEDSRHQFKRSMENPDSLAAEIVAFSNSGGGQLFVGVNDDGTIQGISPEGLRKLNQLVSNVSSQYVAPAVNVATENVALQSGLVTVITVPDGVSKPYMDKNGAIWVKSGSDKRKATSREELQRMFQRGGIIHADETAVSGYSFSNIDLAYFADFFRRQYGSDLDVQPVPLPRLLENMNLAREGTLTLAGALLFGKDPSFYLPEFVIKAVAFTGSDAADTSYRDKRRLNGKLADVFQQALSFAIMYTPHVQGGQDFNSEAVPVVPREVLEELLVNALVHRDYFVSAAVRVFIFADRIEIISPGHLPNNLTVENIKAGNSVSRNPILASYASRILPYSGLGTGIRRALRLYPNITFLDDKEGNLFAVAIAFKL